jgi:hypothetical protein
MGLPLAMGILKQERVLLAFDINPAATKPLDVANGAECARRQRHRHAGFSVIERAAGYQLPKTRD